MSHAEDPPQQVVGVRAREVARRVHGEPAAASDTAYEGLITRAIAFSIDAALINLAAIIVGVAVGLIVSIVDPPNSMDAALIALGGLAWSVWIIAYFVIFWSTTGQTPGNRLLRIRVCDAADRTPLRPRRSFLRLVYLMLAALPLFAGFLPILFDSRRRGLQDMLAGSVVVSAEDEHPPPAP